MRASSTRRIYRRPAFEFQRGGPCIKPSAAHKPDFTISINRPSLQLQQQIILPTNNSNNNKFASNSSRAVMSARSPRRPKIKRNIYALDMFTIADDCGSLSYRDITSLNQSSRNLNTVDLDSIKDLVSLTKLDVSDNNLKMEPFGNLPALEELIMSCNNLSDYKYKKLTDNETNEENNSETNCGENLSGVFGNLKKLNLNFNNLGTDSLNQLSNIPNLTVLHLTHNSLSQLPGDMAQFTKLEYLDLSYNALNKESSFIALASLPALSVLILDHNDITSVPRLHYGFNKLTKISLKSNKIEQANDIVTLADLESLRDVDISENPICILRREISAVEEVYSLSNIRLVHSMEVEKMNFQRSSSRAPRNYANIVKVDLDPLLLPNKELRKKLHSDAHKNDGTSTDEDKANNNQNEEEEDNNISADNNDKEDFEEDEGKKSTQEKVEKDVFMTDFTEVAPIPLPPLPTPLPPPKTSESNEEIFNIWRDIPVIQEQNRKLLANHKSVEKFSDAFGKLKYIVDHPNSLLKSPKAMCVSARNSQRSLASSRRTTGDTTKKSDIVENSDERNKGQLTPLPPSPHQRAKSTRVKKNKDIDIEAKLASKENFSKEEVMKMIQSMENRLNNAEVAINETDDNGLTPVDIALDQSNFSTLHKQYETIRAEIVGTLRT